MCDEFLLICEEGKFVTNNLIVYFVILSLVSVDVNPQDTKLENQGKATLMESVCSSHCAIPVPGKVAYNTRQRVSGLSVVTSQQTKTA